MYKVKVDLYRDWAANLRHELVVAGYDLTKIDDDEAVVQAFWNVQRRLVAPVPRKTLKAREFSCPAHLIQGLQEVERKLAAGENLAPHLSRRLHDVSYNDSLLNHWDIHHLHLGRTAAATSFVERTGPVLFARFDQETAYLIDVHPHGAWTLQSMIRILHDNWPASIQGFRSHGVAMERSHTDESIGKLRKSNVNANVQLEPGVIYRPIGGGYMSSGLGLEVLLRSDYCAERLAEMQEHLIANLGLVVDHAQRCGIVPPKVWEFGVEVKGEMIYAVEVNSGLAVNLGAL